MLLRVKESFSVPDPQGRPFMLTVQKGALVDSEHPLASSHASFMEPATQTVPDFPKKRGRRPKVEQATAAPGEVRTLHVGRPAGDDEAE